MADLIALIGLIQTVGYIIFQDPLTNISFEKLCVTHLGYLLLFLSENQQTIHLHCYGLAENSPAKDYWWGLEFYNTSVSLINHYENIWINESSSELEYVNIEYGGVDPTGQPVPTIRASPTAPHLKEVTIKHCALDATNFTELRGSTVVRDSLFENNRGMSCMCLA